MRTHWYKSPPQLPYFAVIFVSERSEDDEGYQEMDELMMAEALKQPGFLGYSSAGEGRGGIFISYWRDQESIDQWRKHSGHLQAKANAKRWYYYFHSLICEVKSQQEFEHQFTNVKN